MAFAGARELYRGVTSGTKIMVPCYMLASSSLALIFLLQPPGRTSSHIYDGAKHWGIHAWGLLYAASAIWQIAAFCAGRRYALACSVSTAGVLSATWTGFTIWSTAQSPMVSWSGSVFFVVVTCAHTATVWSLVRDRIVTGG